MNKLQFEICKFLMLLIPTGLLSASLAYGFKDELVAAAIYAAASSITLSIRLGIDVVMYQMKTQLNTKQ